MADRPDRTRTNAWLGCVGASALVGLGLLVIFGLLASQASSCSVDRSIGTGDGTRSARLRVVVTPRTGLAPDQAVRVTSSAFGAHEVVGVAVCLREADTERRGGAACDTNRGSRYAVDAAGRLDARFTVPRTITVGSRTYDCADRARRCLVVAADAANFDRSGGQSVSFRPDLPEVALDPSPPRATTRRLPVRGSPTGPVRAGTEIAVSATGFEPGEPVTVAWCSDEVDRVASATEACEITDRAALKAMVLQDLGEVSLHADAQGAVRATAQARATIVPFGSDLAAWVQALDPDGSATADRAAETEVDCRRRAGRCSIVIAAVADVQRSAVLPYELAPG